jgi:hypothetical protein
MVKFCVFVPINGGKPVIVISAAPALTLFVIV